MSAPNGTRLYIVYIRCDPRQGHPRPGAYARCYVLADSPEQATARATEWIEDSEEFLPATEPELLRTLDRGESDADPEEAERIREAWETEVGSIWFHSWDPSAPDADTDPD